jgi:hypothetical protein
MNPVQKIAKPNTTSLQPLRLHTMQRLGILQKFCRNSPVEEHDTSDELGDVSVDQLGLLLVGRVGRHVDNLHREPDSKDPNKLPIYCESSVQYCSSHTAGSLDMYILIHKLLAVR